MKKVIMPEDVYLREHKRLIKTLEGLNKKQILKEAKNQRKEVMDYLKK
jgi:hypothetical protein